MAIRPGEGILSGLIVRVAVFIILFALVFVFTTFSSQHGGLVLGWYSVTSYGWPQPWLDVRVTDKTTVENGKRIPGERTIEPSVEWEPFLVSAGTAAAIAAVLSALVFVLVWPAKKATSEYDQQC